MWKKLVVLIVVIAICLVSDKTVLAVQDPSSIEYFDFTTSDNLLRDGQEIDVKFVWDIKDLDMRDQKRLTVRPFLSGGAVEIFNPDLNRYIGVADFNSLLPYLRESMTIRFFGVQSSRDPLALSFTIYDNLMGRSYKTPVKKVWGTSYYKAYTDLLNENLLKGADSGGIGQKNAEDSPVPQIDKSRDPPQLYIWYLAPAFFLYGLVKSPNGFG